MLISPAAMWYVALASRTHYRDQTKPPPAWLNAELIKVPSQGWGVKTRTRRVGGRPGCSLRFTV